MALRTFYYIDCVTPPVLEARTKFRATPQISRIRDITGHASVWLSGVYGKETLSCPICGAQIAAGHLKYKILHSGVETVSFFFSQSCDCADGQRT